MSKNKNLITREILVEQKVLKDKDPTVSAYVLNHKNRRKIDTLCTYIMNRPSKISECVTLAGISTSMYYRIMRVGRLIQEFSDAEGYEIEGSEYEIVMECYDQINRAIITTESKLEAVAYEALKTEFGDDGRVSGRRATIPEILSLINHRKFREDSIDDEVVDEKPQVIINIGGNSDIIKNLEKSQSNLEDETNDRADQIINQILSNND